MRDLSSTLSQIYSGKRNCPAIPAPDFNAILSLLSEYESQSSPQSADMFPYWEYRSQLSWCVRSWDEVGSGVTVDLWTRKRDKSYTQLKEYVARSKYMTDLFRWCRREKQMTYREVIDFFHMMDKV